MCSYFASGRGSERNERTWGPHRLCDLSALPRWTEAAAANCLDCVSRAPVCGRNGPRLQIHTYFNKFADDWRANLYPMQSFLMTQNLMKARFTVWFDDLKLLDGHPAGEFFSTYAEYVAAKQLLPWEDLVAGTPLRGDPFWGNYTYVRQNIYTMTGYSNVVRLLLVYKYGGMWVDTDVIFLQVKTGPGG